MTTHVDEPTGKVCRYPEGERHYYRYICGAQNGNLKVDIWWLFILKRHRGFVDNLPDMLGEEDEI